MATINRFEDLIAWQKARKLAATVYTASRKGAFAKDFSLADQIRRAAVSIGSNIAEGFDRGNNKEFITFLGIAKGSAAEVRSQFYTAFDVGHLSDCEFEELKSMAEETAKVINGLLTTLRNSTIAGARYHRQ